MLLACVCLVSIKLTTLRSIASFSLLAASHSSTASCSPVVDVDVCGSAHAEAHVLAPSTSTSKLSEGVFHASVSFSASAVSNPPKPSGLEGVDGIGDDG